jgi:hypothetical protein
MSTSTQVSVKSSKPTWQDFEKAIIDILRAGVIYRKPKDKGFMSWYKKQLAELRGAEDPEMHIFEKSTIKFPNEEIYNTTMQELDSFYKKEIKIRKAIENYYNICYNIAKDSFSTEKELEEELNEFINS